MSFIEYAQTLRLPLANHIEAFLNEKAQQNVPLPFFHDVINRLQTFSLKGKLLRGIAVLIAHQMYKGEINNNALNTAAAMELTQSSLLIHDDIMDNDHTRRGDATIFSQFAESQKKNVLNNLFYGQSMGICTGDIGFFLSFELLGKIDNNQTSQTLVQFFSQELQYVGAAQMYDFHYGQTHEEPTEKDILNVYRYKTGRYTFSLPFILGAKLAGAISEDLNILDQFGEQLGIIFQIQDDILGVFGEEKITGKPVGSDIVENKKTLLRNILFSKVSPDHLRHLQSLFGNNNLSHQELVEIQNMCKHYGVLEQLEKLKKEYIASTQDLVKNLQISDKYNNILRELIAYTSERKK